MDAKAEKLYRMGLRVEQRMFQSHPIETSLQKHVLQMKHRDVHKLYTLQQNLCSSAFIHFIQFVVSGYGSVAHCWRCTEACCGDLQLFDARIILFSLRLLAFTLTS
jgi:hypothetical protein